MIARKFRPSDRKPPRKSYIETEAVENFVPSQTLMRATDKDSTPRRR